MTHRLRSALVILAVCLLRLAPATAHPGSGIVVTAQGDIFFVDNSPPPPEGTGKGIVWKLAADGKLTPSADMGGGHWLASDTLGAFTHADFMKWFRPHVTPNFQRVMPADFNPSLILTDACPFVINRDGNLYYADRGQEITRLSPDGSVTNFTPNFSRTTEKLGGITGLACGPDGTLYAACPSALLKINTDGGVSTLVHPIELKDCQHVANSNEPDPYLRGLAVDPAGVVYAVATNCRRVLKITRDGTVSVILRSQGPWLPTGIALADRDIYVLEFTDEPPTRWRPRVRRLQPTQTATVVAEIKR